MIEHLKSGLSLSTHIGCNMGCSYCVLSVLKDFKIGPVVEEGEDALIKRLNDATSLFKNGETPLIINNRTDPMHDKVIDSTIKLLQKLKENKIKSPILIISKFAPDERLKFFWDSLQIMYIYSYSNIDSDFNFGRLETDIRTIAKIVPPESRFHYYRPVIQGSNDALVKVIDCLKKFKEQRFHGSIINGLRINADNKDMVLNQEVNTQHKYLKENTYSNILQYSYKYIPEYSIFRHTSCAVGLFSQRKCKLNYFMRNDHCNMNCKNYGICQEKVHIDKSLIILELKDKFGERLEMAFKENELVVSGKISQEEIAYIKNAYGVSVSADNIIFSLSERSILGYE